MKILTVSIATLLAVSGYSARVPLTQSQIDQQTAARSGQAYRGPGAGPELSLAEYERRFTIQPAAIVQSAANAPAVRAHVPVSDAVAIAQSKRA